MTEAQARLIDGVAKALAPKFDGLAVEIAELQAICDVAAKTKNEEYNRHLCVVCMAGARNVVFMPCSHFVTCKLCSGTLDECPMCRNPIMGKLEVFF